MSMLRLMQELILANAGTVQLGSSDETELFLFLISYRLR